MVIDKIKGVSVGTVIARIVNIFLKPIGFDLVEKVFVKTDLLMIEGDLYLSIKFNNFR